MSSVPQYKWYRPTTDEFFIAHIDGHDVWGDASWNDEIKRPIRVQLVPPKRVKKADLNPVAFFDVMDGTIPPYAKWPDGMADTLRAMFRMKGWSV